MKIETRFHPSTFKSNICVGVFAYKNQLCVMYVYNLQIIAKYDVFINDLYIISGD